MASNADDYSDNSLDSEERLFAVQRPGRLRRAREFRKRRTLEHDAQVVRTRKAGKAFSKAQAIDKELTPLSMPFYRLAQLVRRGTRSGQTAWHAYVAGIEAMEAKAALEKERAAVKHSKRLWKQANAYVECFELEERGEYFTVSNAHVTSIEAFRTDKALVGLSSWFLLL